MNSQDIMDTNNERAEVVRQLQAICDSLGLSYEYTEKLFKIKLPYLEPLPISGVAVARKPKGPDWDFGIKGVDEASDGILPDELPPTTTPLDEGKPPVGDDEK